MILAIWIVTLLVLGLWSLGAWGLHALLVSGVQWAGELKPLLDRIPFNAFFERWLPGWQDTVLLVIQLMQALLDWLGGAAPVLVWLVWGVGAVLLLGFSGILTLVVALVRRNSPPPTPPALSAG